MNVLRFVSIDPDKFKIFFKFRTIDQVKMEIPLEAESRHLES